MARQRRRPRPGRASSREGAAATSSNQQRTGSILPPSTHSDVRGETAFALPEPVLYLTLGRDDIDTCLKQYRFDACQALGLDVEARPSYRRGQSNNRVDTIQLCSESACVVVSLSNAVMLPPLLGHLVSSPTVLKFGCGVSNDLILLAKRFPSTFGHAHLSVDAIACSCVELGVLAPLTGAVDADAPQYGLRRLAAHFGIILEKPKKIQMSDWSRVPLSQAQIR